MTIRPITALHRIGINLMLIIVLSCDRFGEDSIEPQKMVTFSQTEFYTLPGRSVLIDVKSIIERAFTPASLMMSTNPANGTIKEIYPLLLEYTPKPEFIEGKDEIAFRVVLGNGEALEAQTMTVIMKDKSEDFPCGLYAIQDLIHLKTPKTSAIHPLSNDRICGVEEPMVISIYASPKYGEAVVHGDSILYTPGSSFTNGDELVYVLSRAGGEDAVYGIVSIKRTRVEALKNPGGYNGIFFVNDTIGFIAGNRSIFKTYDGGEHWNRLYYFGDESWGTEIQEIFFLDKNIGYAAFLICSEGSDVNDENDVICTGGWIRTKDGGLSWERFDLDSPVGSIFFTSPSTGFITTSKIDRWDKPRTDTILKTVDGGETWAAIATYQSQYGFLKIRFANDVVGYSFQKDRIFYTTDGGKSWSNQVTNMFVSSFALASESVICASLSYYDGSVTTPSTIVRSVDGGAWTTVSSFPYMIMEQAFSHSGDMGIAVGISGPNPSVDPESHDLTISVSTDKGATWTDMPDAIKGFPWAMSVPSSNVAYILCSDKIIRYKSHW